MCWVSYYFLIKPSRVLEVTASHGYSGKLKLTQSTRDRILHPATSGCRTGLLCSIQREWGRFYPTSPPTQFPLEVPLLILKISRPFLHPKVFSSTLLPSVTVINTVNNGILGGKGLFHLTLVSDHPLLRDARAGPQARAEAEARP